MGNRDDLLKRIDELIEERIHEPSLLDHLQLPSLEALGRLIEAGRTPIPGDRLCHFSRNGHTHSEGEWQTPGSAAKTVCQIRRVLGRDSVITVLGEGYAIGVLPEDL